MVPIEALERLKCLERPPIPSVGLDEMLSTPLTHRTLQNQPSKQYWTVLKEDGFTCRPELTCANLSLIHPCLVMHLIGYINLTVGYLHEMTWVVNATICWQPAILQIGRTL